MTPEQVCNIALAEIGTQASISSFSEGNPEANAASTFYTPKIQALLRAALWNCARFQVVLSLQYAAPNTPTNPTSTPPFPPQPWLYSYFLPADFLRARYLLPTLPVNTINPPLTTAPLVALPTYIANCAVPYALGTDLDPLGNRIKVLFTNQPQAQLIYTGDISQMPDLWDSQLLSAATSMLGAYFVNALARNRELMQDQFNIAKGIIDAARISDGDEQPTRQDHIPDWMTIRMSTGAYAWGAGAGWDSLAMPGGMVI